MIISNNPETKRFPENMSIIDKYKLISKSRITIAKFSVYNEKDKTFTHIYMPRIGGRTYLKKCITAEDAYEAGKEIKNDCKQRLTSALRFTKEMALPLRKAARCTTFWR